MNSLRREMLTAAFGLVAVGAIITTDIVSGRGGTGYERLTREAMSAFSKQGYSAQQTEPARYWQATLGTNAVFCYDLKKVPDDRAAYEGCVEMGRHATLIGIHSKPESR